MRNCDRATRAWPKVKSFSLAAFLLIGNSCGGGARFLAIGRWLIVHLSVPSSAVRTPNQPFLLPSFLSRDVARSASDPGTCGGQYPLTASTTIAPSVRPARRTRRSGSRHYPVSPALCVMRRRREKSSETIALRPSTSSFTPQARCHSHMVHGSSRRGFGLLIQDARWCSTTDEDGCEWWKIAETRRISGRVLLATGVSVVRAVDISPSECPMVSITCTESSRFSRSACKAERRGTDAVGDGPGRQCVISSSSGVVSHCCNKH